MIAKGVRRHGDPMRSISHAVRWLSTLVLLGLIAPATRAEPAIAPPAPTTHPTIRPAALLKPAPENLEDLRALQAQVKAVVARVQPTVVGLRIGFGQGSGVIISDDG